MGMSSLVLAMALALTPPAAGQAKPVPAGVGPTLEVAVREFPQTIAAEGVVEAVKQTTLGAQVAGRIVEFAVKAGDTVRARQVLARIDARTADEAVAASLSQVAEAEANLVNAKRKHERNRDLLAQKFVSQAAVDQSEAEYKAAQAQLAAVKASSGRRSRHRHSTRSPRRMRESSARRSPNWATWRSRAGRCSPCSIRVTCA